MDLGKVSWKLSGKGSPILEAIKNICDSWEEVRTATLTGLWKKSTPGLVDAFEGSQALVQEVTADMAEQQEN